MIHEMKDHYRDEEILKLNMWPQIKFWEEHLIFLTNETEFFSKFLTSASLFESERNQEDLRYLLKQLQDLSEMTAFHLKTLIAFKTKVENIRECDDVQCENEYLKEHLLFNQILQKHWKRSLNTKKLIFEYSLGNLSKIQ